MRSTPGKVDRLPPKRREKPDWCDGSLTRVDRSVDGRGDHFIDKHLDRRRRKDMRPAGHLESEGLAHAQKVIWVRCPVCSRRLHPRAHFDWSFDFFTVPRHKTKPASMPAKKRKKT
jgi:hypothetical protein